MVEKLALLIIGWVLGLATTAAQKKFRSRSLKKALEHEISDVLGWLQNSKLHLEMMIQLLVVGESASRGPVKIPVHIYQSNFAEVTLKLNKAERGSFHAIYTRIDDLNEKYDELMALVRTCVEDAGERRRLAGDFGALLQHCFRDDPSDQFPSSQPEKTQSGFLYCT